MRTHIPAIRLRMYMYIYSCAILIIIVINFCHRLHLQCNYPHLLDYFTIFGSNSFGFNLLCCAFVIWQCGRAHNVLTHTVHCTQHILSLDHCFSVVKFNEEILAWHRKTLSRIQVTACKDRNHSLALIRTDDTCVEKYWTYINWN